MIHTYLIKTQMEMQKFDEALKDTGYVIASFSTDNKTEGWRVTIVPLHAFTTQKEALNKLVEE